MKTNAAVLWGLNEPWSVEEVDLDGPKEGEVLRLIRGHRVVPFRPPCPDRRSGRRDTADDRRARGCGRRPGGRPRGPRPDGGRSCGGVIPARVRAVPLVRQRAPEPLRYGRDHPVGHPGRRHIPTPSARAGRRRHGGSRQLLRVEHRVGNIVGQGRRRPAALSCVPTGLRRDDGLGIGRQHRRRDSGRHRRGDRMRRYRQRRDSGRPVGGCRAHRRRRHRGVEAGQGFSVRRHPFRDVDARSHGVGRRPHSRRDGGFRATDRRPAQGPDDQRGARHRPQGRRGGDDRHRLDGRRDAHTADGHDDAVPEAATGQPLRRGQSARGHPATAQPLPRRQAATRRDGDAGVQAATTSTRPTTTCSRAATSAA